MIRHNDPEYFKGAENIQYENSFKNKERRIGYYVELDIPEGAARASFEDVMQKQPEKRMELLKLFIPDIKIFWKISSAGTGRKIFTSESFLEQRQVCDRCHAGGSGRYS